VTLARPLLREELGIVALGSRDRRTTQDLV
jgi:hypothetical protein